MHSRVLELHILGTGTSSAVPSVGCLTSKDKGCFCCRSTLDGTKDGQKNIRRNTSAVLRVPSEDEGGRTKTLLIDCGKTFYTAALEHWPKNGWREIDAVLLTHPHADAVLGLDDLRGWTLHQNVQVSIDIYADQYTFDEISKSFPYLTNTGPATGGGDIPQLNWHIFGNDEPFDILGVQIVPIPVHHGKFFTTPPTPYFCQSFLFDARLYYVSDISFMPESAWETLGKFCSLTPKSPTAEEGTNSLSLAKSSDKKPRIQALIIDCLRIESHMSHFGFPQAIEVARRIGAPRNYLVGFGHMMSHASWLNTTSAFMRSERTTLPLPSDSSIREPKPEFWWETFGGTANPGVEDWEVSKNHALRAVETWEGEKKDGFWVRPACDGLKILMGKGENEVEDDVYGKALENKKRRL